MPPTDLEIEFDDDTSRCFLSPSSSTDETSTPTPNACPSPNYPVSPKSTWGAKIYLVSTHKVQNFPLKPTLLGQITVY